MAISEDKQFCIYCNKDVEYQFGKYDSNAAFSGIVPSLVWTAAWCTECGRRMYIPGLIERNNREMIKRHVVLGGTFPMKIYCSSCKSKQEYALEEDIGVAKIQGEQFAYCISRPFCKKCHSLLYHHDLNEAIILAFRSQFAQRKKFGNIEDAANYFHRMAKEDKVSEWYSTRKDFLL